MLFNYQGLGMNIVIGILIFVLIGVVIYLIVKLSSASTTATSTTNTKKTDTIEDTGEEDTGEEDTEEDTEDTEDEDTGDTEEEDDVGDTLDTEEAGGDSEDILDESDIPPPIGSGTVAPPPQPALTPALPTYHVYQGWLPNDWGIYLYTNESNTGFSVKSESECLTSCKSVDSCRMYEFTPSRNHCALLTPLANNEGSLYWKVGTGGDAYGGTYKMHPKSVINGHDVDGGGPQKTVDDCKKVCDNLTNCNYFFYNGTTCFPKRIEVNNDVKIGLKL